jgi:hypothetical protein
MPFATDLAQHWLMFLTHDMTRYAEFAIGVWLVLWIALAGLLRGRKIRETTPPAKQLVT